MKDFLHAARQQARPRRPRPSCDTRKVTPMRRYQSFFADSVRSAGFEHGDGDIVVDTPAKCGRTWMQMCCLVIVHQMPTLPTRLPEISSWVDTVLGPPGGTHRLLAAQTHRRVMKTHTPPDGLPRLDERVTYVCVAQDPRDVLFSKHDHQAKTNREAVQSARVEGLGAEEAGARTRPPDADRRRDAVPGVGRERQRVRVVERLLRAVLHRVETLWDHPHASNVELFHYSDHLRDLDGQMRRLAPVFGVEADEDCVTMAGPLPRAVDPPATYRSLLQREEPEMIEGDGEEQGRVRATRR
ncbi:MAG TPA: sulfotransferase domain-containing protein [Acidimicrobiales bacterium]|nr:sulfotransferase domain-containing protein [Acidimicrobiales bacterium]